MSHKDKKVVTEVITAIEKHFGALSMTRGNKHSFLGMNIIFNKNNRTVALEMKDQIQESIDMFREAFTEPVSSPATKTLRDKDPAKFHSATAKLLFLTKHAMPDLETAVSFLYTRVSKSTKQDMKKLKRVL